MMIAEILPHTKIYTKIISYILQIFMQYAIMWIADV